MVYLWIGVAAAAAYIIGSIPFGLIIGKIAGKVDIREAGSGNIGATNVGRLLGKKWGFVVFVLDYCKGIVPVLVSCALLQRFLRIELFTANLTAVITGIFAILGHVFPLFLKFKGGKGVATSAGVVTAIKWQVAVICFPLWAVIVLISRYVSVASIIAAVCAPGLYIWLEWGNAFGANLPGTIFCMILALLVIVRHKANIKRLLNGCENKVFTKKAKPQEE